MSEEPVDLAQRCLAGDQNALREFVEVFQQQVFGLCFRMLGHRQDAEDTAQESLARAVKYLKSWDSTQPLRPWVLKIAANRCRTALGKRARLPKTVGESNDFGAESEFPQLGLAEELNQALDVLKDEHRECFVMFYQQELSIQEISAVLEIKEGTIKTWLHRSRKLLAEHLMKRGIEPNSH
ncbi:RNA polymerase sigma factor [Thalassoglobus sp.]|uniref:RNA polymerase sigma factor n=1 Tax=Thalassoglobus sp. TaxID=2795869 RepID=UPI003AA8D8C4